MSAVWLVLYSWWPLLVLATKGNALSSGILQEMERTEGWNGSITTSPLPITLAQMMTKLTDLDSTYNNSCVVDVTAFISALTSSEPPTWALSMLDSFGKPGSHLLKGNLRWAGSYSQCRNVLQENNNLGRPFHGKFCWAYLEMQNEAKHLVMPGSNMDITFSLGICAPDTCTDAQLLQAAKLYTDLHPVPLLNEYIKLTDVKCLRQPNIWENKTDTVSVFLVSFIALLVLVGTCCDLWKQHGPTQIQTEGLSTTDTPRWYFWLLAISAYSNGKKILKLDGGKQNLPALNGIRVISMMWIITAHTYLGSLMMADDPKNIVDSSRAFLQMTIAQGIYAVDTFLFLSGVLVTYSFLKEHKRTEGKNSWTKFYVHRYWRLTPTYFLIIWFMTVSLTKYFGHGPFWTRPFEESATCQSYWWANILYINNFMPSEGQCMGHTFYLAIDMQFYILSPILLIPFTRSVRISVLLAVLMIAGTCITSGLLGITNDFPITIALDKTPPGSDSYNTMYNTTYNKPYTRIGPYLVGMLTGWLLQRKIPVPMSKILAALGWTICITTMLLLIYVPTYTEDNFVMKGVFHTFGRVVWSACIGWMVVACCSGCGGVINHLLSLSIWNPMSRLTYCAFLWHNGSLVSHLGQLETLIHSSPAHVYIISVCVIIGVYAEAFVLSLLFEAPFAGLESWLLRPKKNSREQ